MSLSIGLEHLPIDVVECIANYLNVNDLCTCGAVSKTWYNIFNNDIFWKKHCNRRLGDYLRSTDCQVVPVFTEPCDSNCTLPSLNSDRLNYMHEKHLWRNWSLGRYKLEEIEFDCDDNISYNIKVEFVANEFVFLHTTFQTEIWDVSQKPILIMEIPFKLKEMWEETVCKSSENKLIVIQCNVVQVFNILLPLKSWSFDFAFFFNQSEEFSSNIKEETDIDAIFQKTSFSIADDVVHAICGDYFVGFVTTEELMMIPVMHVWNLKTGKKVKEQLCDVYKLRTVKPYDIRFKVYETRNIVLILFDTAQGSIYGIYNLVGLEFLVINDHFHQGNILIHSNYLCYWENLKVLVHDWLSNTNFDHPDIGNVIEFENFISLQVLNNTELVILNDKTVEIVNPSNKLRSVMFQLNFTISEFNIVLERFLAFHDMEYCIREIWQVGNPCRKILSFATDFGTYRAVNEMCTKIVLVQANKLIVLNFW